MYFATDGQDAARSHLKSCLREFSPSGPKDDGSKSDDDADDDYLYLFDDSGTNPTDS